MQSPEGWAAPWTPAAALSCRALKKIREPMRGEQHRRERRLSCMVRDAFVLDLSYLYLLALRLVAVHRSVSRETGLFLLKLISRDHPNAPGCGDAAGRILYEPGIDGDPGSGGFP